VRKKVALSVCFSALSVDLVQHEITRLMLWIKSVQNYSVNQYEQQVTRKVSLPEIKKNIPNKEVVSL